jgi:hypothetical protein
MREDWTAVEERRFSAASKRAENWPLGPEGYRG